VAVHGASRYPSVLGSPVSFVPSLLYGSCGMALRVVQRA
jgi:hypothetical protein